MASGPGGVGARMLVRSGSAPIDGERVDSRSRPPCERDVEVLLRTPTGRIVQNLPGRAYEMVTLVIMPSAELDNGRSWRNRRKCERSEIVYTMTSAIFKPADCFGPAISAHAAVARKEPHLDAGN